jgi:protein-S-isoprenylcysteine O-methyltransferase Ste14
MKKGYLYVLAQVVLTIAVAIGPYFHERNGSTFIGKTLITLGLIIVLVSLRYLGKSITPSPYPKESGELITDGIYAYFRHPIYSGLFLIASGYTVYFGSIFSAIATIFLVYVLYKKSVYEEKLLKEKFGSKYEKYCEKVKRFIPKIF